MINKWINIPNLVALGKIEVAKRRGVPMPDGWGADGQGENTNAKDNNYKKMIL